MTVYEELKNKHGFVEAFVGINEDKEPVIVSIDEQEASIRTLQKNNWIRVNVYYPDGTQEEYFEDNIHYKS